MYPKQRQKFVLKDRRTDTFVLQSTITYSTIKMYQIVHQMKREIFSIHGRRLRMAGRMRADEGGNRDNGEILELSWSPQGQNDAPDVVPPILAYADLLATNGGRN